MHVSVWENPSQHVSCEYYSSGVRPERCVLLLVKKQLSGLSLFQQFPPDIQCEERGREEWKSPAIMCSLQSIFKYITWGPHREGKSNDFKCLILGLKEHKQSIRISPIQSQIPNETQTLIYCRSDYCSSLSSFDNLLSSWSIENTHKHLFFVVVDKIHPIISRR